MTASENLDSHLAECTTSVARCWLLTRRDGTALGFTDHDMPLEFEGNTFAASSGLTARALQQGTGLAVDNSEAIGALSDTSIRDEDVTVGRFDGAKVQVWLVNWQNVDERRLQFAGEIGEITRVDGQFTAELRGQTEALNRPAGRVYQKPCTAVLGDASCKFDLTQPGYSLETPVLRVWNNRELDLGALPGFDPGWFTKGTAIPIDGDAVDVTAVIKEDRGEGQDRRLVLWSDLRAPLREGDRIKIVAGCDKRAETCRLKFNNFLNFRGFPHIPGEDWLISYPTRSGRNDGGALS